MPRKARVESNTGYYHVMLRGHNKEWIFTQEGQKKEFLSLLKKEQDDKVIEIAAWCLMSNHIHLVLKADLDNLSRAMKRVNIKFAMHYNYHHNRVGHVFQDRYKSQAIEDEEYLVQVIRYVHNNPVKAEIVQNIGEYKWSSYREYFDQVKWIFPKQKQWVLNFFNHSMDTFVSYHHKNDECEYLDIKEDIEHNRQRLAQNIIEDYIKSKSLHDKKEILIHTMRLEEVIELLLINSKLTHRKIAKLMDINVNKVHQMSKRLNYKTNIS